MKKKIFALASLLLIGGFTMFFMNSCDKDTTCYVQIKVVDEESKDPVSNVFVKIDIDSSYINSQGYTDANGIFETQFSAPAIFNVVARYETGYDDETYPQDRYYCYRKGNNTIRLKEGDTVKSTINLETDIQREFRN